MKTMMTEIRRGLLLDSKSVRKRVKYCRRMAKEARLLADLHTHYGRPAKANAEKLRAESWDKKAAAAVSGETGTAP